MRDLALITGTANPALARRVATYLDVPLLEAVVARYPDGEIEVRLEESVRGRDCFVLQPTCPPVHDHLMELLVLADALRRASAARVTAVVPYFGYARQDRKTGAREPVTAKLVANLMVRAGVQHLLALDLHAGQISGFFDIPLDHLGARMLLADYFLHKGLRNVVVVSPDVGGVRRAREFAQVLGAPLAIIDKRRDRPNQVAEVVHVIGKVYRRTAILVDDIVDTAGTLVRAAETLVRRGVTEVYACCTHPVLSGPAVERIAASPIRELVVTDSIPLPADKRLDQIRVVSVARLLADAITRVHLRSSVSELAEERLAAELV
ncbi:MAG: ribose-phosphate pyrophosphokinase [Armatimonadota bacterium]|nr:ribose-phosphate pyrophosphokinase [Armatimonadota bacterium]MDR7414204.1 ribose-phosphate pyrophosphokinase [Armatimonadota bacterium]MDR7429469.1 ribose-phosphate pyrophosphokinase [Armatimonadota bacterium]MDR7432278.1 ribose-phosphate pyrophosphokinase [Armatimonadota bacterium]MDR7476381.1 ribose-phosphate pyrophosphokinase [Armatimonadota bacterium]